MGGNFITKNELNYKRVKTDSSVLRQVPSRGVLYKGSIFRRGLEAQAHTGCELERQFSAQNCRIMQKNN